MKKLAILILCSALVLVAQEAMAVFIPLGPISYEQAQSMAKEANEEDPVAGIYELSKGRYQGRFLVIPNELEERPEAKYVALSVKSTNPKEPIGAVKFWLFEQEPPSLFGAEYYDFSTFGTVGSSKKRRKAYVLPRQILVHIYDFGNGPPNQFVKIYP